MAGVEVLRNPGEVAQAARVAGVEVLRNPGEVAQAAWVAGVEVLRNPGEVRRDLLLVTKWTMVSCFSRKVPRCSAGASEDSSAGHARCSLSRPPRRMEVLFLADTIFPQWGGALSWGTRRRRNCGVMPLG